MISSAGEELPYSNLGPRGFDLKLVLKWFPQWSAPGPDSVAYNETSEGTTRAQARITRLFDRFFASGYVLNV